MEWREHRDAMVREVLSCIEVHLEAMIERRSECLPNNSLMRAAICFDSVCNLTNESRKRRDPGFMPKKYCRIRFTWLFDFSSNIT